MAETGLGQVREARILIQAGARIAKNMRNIVAPCFGAGTIIRFGRALALWRKQEADPSSRIGRRVLCGVTRRV